MKKISCKICGSTDVVVQNNTVICNVCKNKYTLPTTENKKKVHHIKIDKTDEALNFIQRAEDFYKKENFSESIEYSNKALDIDSKNIQALLIKGKASFVVKLEDAIFCFDKIYSSDKTCFNEEINTFLKEIEDKIQHTENYSECLVYLRFYYKYLLHLEEKKQDEANLKNRYIFIQQILEKNLFFEKADDTDEKFILLLLSDILPVLAKKIDFSEKFQKIILSFGDELLSEYVEDSYTDYITGHFHSPQTRDYPNIADRKELNEILEDSLEFCDIIFKYCPKGEKENKINICQLFSEYLDFYITVPVKDHGNFYTMKEEYKLDYEKKIKKFTKCAEELNPNGEFDQSDEEWEESDTETEEENEEEEEEENEEDNNDQEEDQSSEDDEPNEDNIEDDTTENNNSNKRKTKLYVLIILLCLLFLTGITVSFNMIKEKSDTTTSTEEKVIEKDFICERNVQCGENYSYIVHKVSGEPITGEVKEFYPYTNTLKASFGVKEGRLDGIFNEYYENGKISKTGFMNYGIKEGQFKEFDENGILLKTISYTDGLLNGNTEEFYQNGTLKGVYPFKNDELNGNVLKYSKDGELIAKISYINGEKKGTNLVNKNQKNTQISNKDCKNVYIEHFFLDDTQFSNEENHLRRGLNEAIKKSKKICLVQLNDESPLHIDDTPSKDYWTEKGVDLLVYGNIVSSADPDNIKLFYRIWDVKHNKSLESKSLESSNLDAIKDIVLENIIKLSK